MLFKFSKENYNSKTKSITLHVGWKEFKKIEKLSKIDVKSTHTGVVRTFNYNKVKTDIYCMDNECWDGEYQCMLFDSLGGKEHSDIVVEIGTGAFVGVE